MMKERKALSPVVASIILFAVTVAVGIAVAAWMGALTFNFMKDRAPLDKIHFNNDFTEYEIRLHGNGISIVTATQIDADATLQVNNFDDFLSGCVLNNITCVITDYKNFEIPAINKANTSYVIENYSFWFYQDVPHVGKVAVFTTQTLGAYWLGD